MSAKWVGVISEPNSGTEPLPRNTLNSNDANSKATTIANYVNMDNPTKPGGFYGSRFFRSLDLLSPAARW